MQLFQLNKENEEEKKMLAFYKAQNIAFMIEDKDNVSISCTCGFCEKVKEKGYREREVYEFYRKEKVDGRRWLKEIYVCPGCETEVFFDVSDDDYKYGASYLPTIIGDTEEFFDVKLDQYIIERDLYKIEHRESYGESLMIRFNKKDKTLKFYYYNPYDYGNEDWDELEEVTEVKDFFDYSDYILKQGASYSGLAELQKMFEPYIKNMCSIEEFSDIDLENVLEDMYMSSVSTLYTAVRSREDYFCIYKNGIEAKIDFLNGLTKYGVDINASTLEEAIGCGTDEIKAIGCWENLVPYKRWKDLMENTGVKSYLEEVEVEFDPKERETALELFDKSECKNFEDFMKYIIRGIVAEKLNLGYVLNRLATMIRFCSEKAEGYERAQEDVKMLIDYKKAYSNATFKKYQMIHDKLIDFDTLKKLQKKPTMDTLLKIIS